MSRRLTIIQNFIVVSAILLQPCLVEPTTTSQTANYPWTQRGPILTAKISPASILRRPWRSMHDLKPDLTTTSTSTSTSSQLSPCISHCTNVLSIRGGSDEEDYDESDFEDDDFVGGDFFDDMDDADFLDAAAAAEGDFDEENMLGRAADQWKQTPPLTKVYMSASLVATALGYVLNQNQFPSVFLLEWKPILHRMQIWRPFTAFLNFGPFGLGYIMTGHFVWTYMSTLERLNHDRPYDFWMMIAFGCSSMVTGYTLLNISPRFLGHNLSTFLVYVWSRYHEGLEVNIMELFNARAEMLPWFFLAQTFLLEGELPTLDLLGILFGHIYHHCKTTNIIRTPKFIIDWYESDNFYSTKIREKYKKISSDFELQ